MSKESKKSMMLLVAVLIVLFSNFSVCYAESLPSPENATYLNGHLYLVVDDSMKWSKAKKVCEKVHGHLVVVTGEEETQLLINLTNETTKNLYWIGLQRTKGSNPWHWVTGETLDYTNWAKGEPNYLGKKEKYGEFYSVRSLKYTKVNAGEWNDARESGSTPQSKWWGLKNIGYICEWDSDVRENTKNRRTTWICSYGHEIESEVCPVCGEHQQIETTSASCLNCGKVFDGDIPNFCPDCGTKIE